MGEVYKRQAEARKGRDKIHAAGGVDLLRIILRVACLAEEAHLVAQPLDNGPADKDAALEGIGHMAAEPGCNGRDKAVAADAGRLARVHEQEAARAVGILGPVSYTHLAARRLCAAEPAR